LIDNIIKIQGIDRKFKNKFMKMFLNPQLNHSHEYTFEEMEGMFNMRRLSDQQDELNEEDLKKFYF
jgi:hypothetical protein